MHGAWQRLYGAPTNGGAQLLMPDAVQSLSVLQLQWAVAAWQLEPAELDLQSASLPQPQRRGSSEKDRHLAPAPDPEQRLCAEQPEQTPSSQRGLPLMVQWASAVQATQLPLAEQRGAYWPPQWAGEVQATQRPEAVWQRGRAGLLQSPWALQGAAQTLVSNSWPRHLRPAAQSASALQPQTGEANSSLMQRWPCCLPVQPASAVQRQSPVVVSQVGPRAPGLDAQCWSLRHSTQRLLVAS